MTDDGTDRAYDPFTDSPHLLRRPGFFESANLHARLRTAGRLFVGRQLLYTIADLSESDFWVIITLDRMASRAIKRQIIAMIAILYGSGPLQTGLITALKWWTGENIPPSVSRLPILTFALILVGMYLTFWTSRFAGGRMASRLTTLLGALQPPSSRWHQRRDRWFRPSILERRALRTRRLRRALNSAAIQISYDTALLRGYYRSDNRRFANDSSARVIQQIARNPDDPTNRLAILMIVLLLGRQIATNQPPVLTADVDYLPSLEVSLGSRLSNSLRNPILIGICIPFVILTLDKLVDIVTK